MEPASEPPVKMSRVEHVPGWKPRPDAVGWWWMVDLRTEEAEAVWVDLCPGCSTRGLRIWQAGSAQPLDKYSATYFNFCNLGMAPPPRTQRVYEDGTTRDNNPRLVAPWLNHNP